MKIQGMAIIFIIIILPITIVVGEYAATQIEMFRLEQLFDSRLITATDDALKAFQINTFNDAYSSISNSKIESIEASVNAFYNSMVSSFGMQGYSGEELLNYVPALVYTMYDGYYIYSPYTNVADISEGTGLKIDLGSTTIEYGLKPYVYYSCRYTMGANSDFIINYSLDNYITVQGIVNGEFVYKSGYLLTLDEDKGLSKKTTNGFVKYYYNGQEIPAESDMVDLLIDKDAEGNTTSNPYKYIKLNDIKYYWDEDDELIFYLAGEARVEQAKKSKNEDKYNQYVNQIQLNRSAINYYKSAYEFTNWVKDNLGNLKLKNAETDVPLSGDPEDNVFIVDEENNKIEYAGSNFNLHRKEVIRYSIESNLSVAIANFNSYTSSNTSFQMPKLKETEWDLLQSEVSIISFLQGLNLGGKLYNGYTVVSNTKTEEVVTEDSIYITTNDGYYHRINAKYFDEDDDIVDSVVAGVLNLDFETRKDGATGLPYRQKTEYGSYTSIVGQEQVNTDYDSIYEYLDGESIAENVKQIYYTALGRERWSTYQIENSSNLLERISKMTPSNDYEIVTDGLIRHYEATNTDGQGNIELGTTEWIDLSGHYDGIISGSTVTSEGYVSFDGTDDWVNIGKISDMDAITLEATFLLNSLPTGSNSYQIISNTQFTGFALYLNKNGRLFFNIRSEEGEDSNQLTIHSSVNLETNRIYNVSVTYDGSVVKLYINGYVYAEAEYYGKIYEPKYDTVTSIGVNPSDSPSSFYGYADVNIYSARIYDRALTKEEINKNMQSISVNLDSLNIVTDSLIRYYDASNIDGSGNAGSATTSIWRDLTGNHNATIWGASASPDGYVSLDGVNDWVNTGNITGLEQVTLEASVMLKQIPATRSCIISNSNSGGTSLYIDADGKPAFVIKSANNGGEYSVTGNVALNLGQAYNITGVYDGSKVYIYVNGSLANSAVAVAGQIKNPTENTVMAIGCNPYGSESEFYFANMNVYTARIYNKGLTADEVKTNYNAEKDKLPEPDKEPIITISNLNISPNAYLSTKQKPSLSALVEVESGGTTIDDIQYAFTQSETFPTDGWQGNIATDGESASATLAKQVTTSGKWYLHVKARAGYAVAPKTVDFDEIILDSIAPTITVTEAGKESTGENYTAYEIPADSTSITVAKHVFASDAIGIKTTKSIYATSSVAPSDDAGWSTYTTGNVVAKQITEPGIYYLHIKATDLAGNTTTRCVPFTVTKEEEATYTIKITDTNKTIDTTNYTDTFNSIYSFRKTITVTTTGAALTPTIEYAFIQEGTTLKDTDWQTYSTSTGIVRTVTAPNSPMTYKLYVRAKSGSTILAEKQQTYVFNPKSDVVITDPVPGGNTVVM